MQHQRLVNRTQNDTVITSQLETAQTYFARMKGLLGRKPDDFSGDAGLWIRECNSIHMWFMRFAIDAVFVDQDLKVKRVYQNLRPWRVTTLVWGASSVFELPAGTLKKTPVQTGDQLHVGA